MKKFKLFALAVMAMLSTNAFAAVGDVKAAGNFRYEVTNATAGSEAATIIGFVAGHEQAEVVIPSTVADPDADITYKVTAIGKATTTAASLFQNLDVITKVTIPDENVATLTDNAFTGCKNLTAVTIGKAVTSIGEEAFMNCAKLATVTFNAPAADAAALTITEKAFEGTAITELDLTNTNMTTLSNLFTNDDDVADTYTKNKKLTTIKLPKTLTTIAANAFDNCMLLETIDFSKCEADLTINKKAFEGTIFLEELELPACVATIAADALAGSSITTLTINSHKTAGKPAINAIGGDDLTTIIVKGDFVGAFGDGTKAVSETATSITFKGKVGAGAIKANAGKAAVAANAKLATVTFEGDLATGAIAKNAFTLAPKLATVEFKGNLAAGAVADAAFGDGTDYAGKSLGTGKYLTVKYNPTKSATTNVLSFVQTAFQTSANKATKVAKLSTATWYKALILAAAADGGYDNTGDGIYGVELDAAAATKSLEVLNNGEGKYYYAQLEADGNYKIKAAQNGGKVMVYAAYIDRAEKVNTVYMDQLHIIGGYYYVRADNNGAGINKGVVVKATVGDKPVEATAMSDTENANAALDSYHYVKAGATTRNDILVTDEELLGQELMNTDATKDFYFLAPFEDYGLFWSKFKGTRTLPAGTFYLTIDKAAGARLNVVWLDGSEEDATAIQTVKKANAENGAIYNLAGQKVNASYKGVVIKDGKKYIQK